MKILLTSDWHLDTTTIGRPRLPDLVDYVDRLVDIAVTQGAQLIVNLGDTMTPGTHGALDIHYACELSNLASRIEDRGIETIWVAGNHDVIEGSPYTALAPLAMSDRPGRAVVQWPGLVETQGCRFLCFPYVARDRHDEAIEAAEAAIDQQRGVSADLGGPLVVLSHWYLRGARLGNESIEFQRGRDLWLPTGPLAQLGPALVANGHYHRRQIVKVDGLEILIPGSALALTFNQDHDPRGAFLVDL